MACPKFKPLFFLTFITGLVECLCFAGVIFGWAALVFVLKSEGYFESSCVNITSANGTQTLDCRAQDEQFSLVFTIASSLNSFFTLPCGIFFDRFGTLVTRICAICVYTGGMLMVGLSSPVLAILLFPAMCCIAIGGVLILISNIQVGNLFGPRRFTVITLYNGAFDSSAALFFVLKLIHESGISLHHLFLFVAACSVIPLLRTFFLLPRHFIPHPLPENYTFRSPCSARKSQTAEQLKEEPAVPEIPEKTFRECVLSRLFLLHIIWLSVMQLRHLLFIGTLNPMLLRLTEGEPSLVSEYINAFSITQMCGVLCAPWNGLIMDRHKGKPRAEGMSEQEADLNSSWLSLLLTALQCLLFSLCASIPSLPLQYLTFILQVLNRSFLYGGNAAFLSVAFPSYHFGKLFGLVMSVSTVVSLLQYPCFTIVEDVLGGEPLYVNIGLTVLSLLAFVHPLSVYLHCRKLIPQRAANKAQGLNILGF
ncbi:equilibrative nucleobase transporter 1-like [Synchiropus splendidus]|uniref:equilibrative nucleobase transporter 1-like n=1 Tax=Synchiropus splendidus TaxID=270530 RepID=UPI00237E3CE0|nr:equilibrative nucleobase transporter 1-like [Synchiropus splendidus]